jgi:hypothetical protein
MATKETALPEKAAEIERCTGILRFRMVDHLVHGAGNDWSTAILLPFFAENIARKFRFFGREEQLPCLFPKSIKRLDGERVSVEEEFTVACSFRKTAPPSSVSNRFLDIPAEGGLQTVSRDCLGNLPRTGHHQTLATPPWMIKGLAGTPMLDPIARYLKPGRPVEKHPKHEDKYGSVPGRSLPWMGKRREVRLSDRPVNSSASALSEVFEMRTVILEEPAGKEKTFRHFHGTSGKAARAIHQEFSPEPFSLVGGQTGRRDSGGSIGSVVDAVPEFAQAQTGEDPNDGYSLKRPPRNSGGFKAASRFPLVDPNIIRRRKSPEQHGRLFLYPSRERQENEPFPEIETNRQSAADSIPQLIVSGRREAKASSSGETAFPESAHPRPNPTMAVSIAGKGQEGLSPYGVRKDIPAISAGELGTLVDRVYSMLVKRLKRERELRGY